MNKNLVLISAFVLALSIIQPAKANGPLGSIASFFGSVTATIIDIPQGILVDSLYRMPLKTQRTLAEKFGDDKGFQQNVAGAVIGIPVGFVWGIPYGALHGGRHGMTVGWEKPFSTESFLVTEEK